MTLVDAVSTSLLMKMVSVTCHLQQIPPVAIVREDKSPRFFRLKLSVRRAWGVPKAKLYFAVIPP